MAHDVFISYSSKDKPTGDAVCARLEANGVRCWIAPRDVLPSLPYGEAIIQAIHSSRLMVLIFSDHSNRSQQVMREVERAVSQGIPILPFRIEDVPLTPSMEYFISAPHWLDAMTGPLEEHLERLANTAQRILSQEEPTPPNDANPKTAKRSPDSPMRPTPDSVGSAEPVRLNPIRNRLLLILGLAILLLVGAWGASKLSSTGAKNRQVDRGPSVPAAESTIASNQESAQPPMTAPSTDEDEKSASGKLQGKVGEELSDGKWRFKVLAFRPVPSYTMKRTTEADYAAYHELAEFNDTTFRPKTGNTLLVFECRVKNEMKEKQSLWHFNTNTAVQTHQKESYPPIAFDMRGGMTQSTSLLPQTQQDFALVFALPQDSKPAELVFTLKTIDDKEGADLHVSL